MADLIFNCPYCEQKIEVRGEAADTKAECPSCQCEVHIPKQTQTKPVPLAPASSSELTADRQHNATPRFVAAKCPNCGGDLQVPDNRDQVKCMYCGGAVIVRQAIHSAVSGVNAANLMEQAKAATKRNTAEQLHLRATFKLHECQAHYSVYGQLLTRQAKDGLEFVEEALRLFPDDPNYLNTKALLIADGIGDRQIGASILKKASDMAPADIQIRQNIRNLQQAAESENKLKIVVIVIAVLALLYVISLVYHQ